MRARIHRGATEIGGSCIEVEAAGERIVLDAGLPLSLDGVQMRDLMPDVPGLWAAGDGTLRALLISHGHPDHCGLADLVAPEVDVYAGEATVRIAQEAAFFTPSRELHADAAFTDGQTFRVGPFAVTPVLVDHSAFDAHAFVIEADGKTLVYSGDLRGHGRKPGSLARLAGAATGADILVLEGTRLSRPDEDPFTERDVEDRVLELCRSTPGLVLAAASGQNLDRLVSLFRAAKRAKRQLVLDLYASSVLAAAGRSSLPAARWAGVRVYVPRTQSAKVANTREFHRTQDVRAARVFPEELAAAPERFVMLFRGSMANELESTGALRNATLVWSMWPGYLNGDRRIQALLANGDVTVHVVHASGHASVADLRELIAACGARRVVPVHTAAPDAFGELSPTVELRVNGEWWDV